MSDFNDPRDAERDWKIPPPADDGFPEDLPDDKGDPSMPPDVQLDDPPMEDTVVWHEPTKQERDENIERYRREQAAALATHKGRFSMQSAKAIYSFLKGEE